MAAMTQSKKTRLTQTEEEEMERLAPVRIFVIRHSKSCSNLAREAAPLTARGQGSSHPDVLASENLKDPGLTFAGRALADGYRAKLHRRLARLGFEVSAMRSGASPLLRARQTAKLLFPNSRVEVFTGLGEEGEVPENTPAGQRYARPNWDLFLQAVAALAMQEGAHDIAVVAHGSFIRRVVSSLTREPKMPRLCNLSGFLLTCRLHRDRHLVVTKVQPIPYPRPGAFDNRNGDDSCPVYKIADNFSPRGCARRLWPRSSSLKTPFTSTLRYLVPILTFPAGALGEAWACYVALPGLEGATYILALVQISVNLIGGAATYPGMITRGLKSLKPSEKSKTK